ncbi:hypothetical protein JCM10207_002873 [Rhodosporidiobolus poonsookiae]
MTTTHRRICVFIDGTGQNGETEPNPALHTNVKILFDKLTDEDSRGGIRQEKFYIRGVGTGDGWLKDAWGATTGEGLKARVKEAYGKISRTWHPGDEIHLFGFSRGAYAVRLLASLISLVGILDRKCRKKYFDALFEALDDQKGELDGGTHDDSAAVKRWGELYAKIKPYKLRDEREHLEARGNSFLINTLFCFDTVDTRGMPPLIKPKASETVDHTNSFGIDGTLLEDCVQHAYHALALDETRTVFSPLIWRQSTHPPDGQHLLQVWFAGSHTDIGGGYPEQDLRWITLVWAWSLLERKLRFDDTWFANLGRDGTAAGYGQATVNQENQWWWKLGAGKSRRAVPEERDRATNELYHFSVEDRPHNLLHPTIQEIGIRGLRERRLFTTENPLETRMAKQWAREGRARSLSPPYPVERGEERPVVLKSQQADGRPYPQRMSNEELLFPEENLPIRSRRRVHRPRSRASSSASGQHSPLHEALWSGSPAASRSPLPSPENSTPATPLSVQSRSRAHSTAGGLLAPPPVLGRHRASSTASSTSHSPHQSDDEDEYPTRRRRHSRADAHGEARSRERDHERDVAVGYLSRAGSSAGNSEVSDRERAAQYLER